MSRKISVGITISMVIVAITATFAITMSISQRIYNGLINDLPERTQMYSSIAEIDELVRSKYLGTIDESTLNANVAGGYVDGLGDKYSYYMNADEFAQYQTVISGKSTGIGIKTALNSKSGYMTVTEVFADSPAESSGFKKGDEISHINDEAVNAENYNEMVKKLEGRTLTNINVTYIRNKISKTVNVMMGYSSQSVSHKLIGEVGYIRINAFYENTATQVSSAIESLTDKGAMSLVFDLRNTSEGSIEYATRVLDLLVPVASEGSGALATAVDKGGKTVKVFSSDSTNVSMRMVVIVNSGTCGGAELFACDLRDFGKAWIVGNTTKGNGTMQEVFRLDDGGAIMLTVAKIIPYKSESFDKTGIAPDYEISLKNALDSKFELLDESEDNQLQAALSLLAGQ
jgi:carboxyl-terminal processing protease